MTTINELAAQMTIEQLGWPTIEDIEKAHRLIVVYNKNAQRIKGDLKLKRRQIEYQRWLADEKVKCPEKCFCDEDGIEVERKWEEDGILGYYTTYMPYDRYHEHPSQSAYYKCSNCGKRYTQ